MGVLRASLACELGACVISVVIPFGGSDPHRLAALKWVAGRYRELGWQVQIGGAEGTTWCKAVAVANALRAATGDLLVVADGDVWAENIQAAVEAVDEGAEWACPFTKVYRQSPLQTERMLTGAPPSVAHRDLAHVPYTGAPGGGIVVVPRETYGQIPIDPRFVGWGGEDWAWGYALTTLAGPPARSTGPLWHAWHPPQPRNRAAGLSGSVANEKLRIRYRDARTDPAAMRKLVDEVMTDDATSRLRRRVP